MPAKAIRTLFITGYYPLPARAARQIYSGHLIRILAETSTQVDVLCQTYSGQNFVGEKVSSQFPQKVSFFIQPAWQPSLISRALSGLPNAAIHHATQANRIRLEELLERNPDIVVVDNIASAWAYLHLKRYHARHPDVQVVYCTHNMERDLRLMQLKASFTRPMIFLGSLIDVFRIDRADARLADFADVLTCITSADKDRYIAHYKVKRAIVVRPTYKGSICATRSIDASVPRRVCIVGNFDWSVKRHNLSVFLKIAYKPFIAKDIEISVIGWMDPKYRAALEARWPKVRFTGAVDHIEPYIARCRIGIMAEGVGGGFKLTSLMYIFNRLPIFALDKVIVDLPLVANENVKVFSSVQDLCNSVLADVDDFSILNKMQEGAFSVCSSFRSDWEPKTTFLEVLRGSRERI